MAKKLKSKEQKQKQLQVVNNQNVWEWFLSYLNGSMKLLRGFDRRNGEINGDRPNKYLRDVMLIVHGGFSAFHLKTERSILYIRIRPRSSDPRRPSKRELIRQKKSFIALCKEKRETATGNEGVFYRANRVFRFTENFEPQPEPQLIEEVGKEQTASEFYESLLETNGKPYFNWKKTVDENGVESHTFERGYSFRVTRKSPSEDLYSLYLGDSLVMKEDNTSLELPFLSCDKLAHFLLYRSFNHLMHGHEPEHEEEARLFSSLLPELKK